MLAVVAVAVAVIFSRRPDALTTPQFYAEDGAQWFQDAYAMGAWQALFVSYQGHFLLQPRLVALIATPFGPGPAPLIYNLLGLGFQVAPILLFLSRRFEVVLPAIWVRLALSAVYLVMPSAELNVTIASAQFHLAILAVLVLIAPPPENRWWGAFDLVTVALCALTGAFVYVLLPCAVIWWAVRRRAWTGVLCAVLTAGLVAQVWSLFLGPRGQYPLGANLPDLFIIICDRVILGGLFAEVGGTHVVVAGLPHAGLIALGVCAVAAPIVAYALLRAPWELRVFDLFAGGIAAAGIAQPLVSAQGHQWMIMATTNSGERYFLMAQVAGVVTLLWAASRLPRAWLRGGAWLLTAAAMASGLVAAWQYPAFINYDWPHEASLITSSAPGTHLSLPINPGPPWAVTITVR